MPERGEEGLSQTPTAPPRRLPGARVLVTGAGGFIASHLIEHLVTIGVRVRAFVRHRSDGHPGLLRTLPAAVFDAIEIIAGDIRDPSAVAAAVRGMEYVFHLAAEVSIPYSQLNPRESVSVNVEGTLNLLEALRQHEIARLVHTSTSEVYGTATRPRISESHPICGQSPYAASKIAADQLVESYVRSFDIRAITVRPFNTYGPRQTVRAVIPTIVSQALRGGPLVLGALEPTRDFTFVTDTVRGLVRGAETEDENIGKVFNLGTGSDVSIRALGELICSKVGCEWAVSQSPDRVRPGPSEVMRLCSDNREARERLGWVPEISLSDGLDRVIEAMRRVQ